MLRGREELKNRGGWGNGRGCGRWGCPEVAPRGPAHSQSTPSLLRHPPSLLARADRTLRWASRGTRAADGGIFDVELGEKWLLILLRDLYGSAEPRRHGLQAFNSSRSTRAASGALGASWAGVGGWEVLSFGFYRVRLRYLVRFYSLSRVLSFLLCITCLFFAGAHRGFSTRIPQSCKGRAHGSSLSERPVCSLAF